MELAGIRQALGQLDDAARTASTLADVRVRPFFAGRATATARSHAATLDEQLLDAIASMRQLDIDPRIPQGVEDAATGVRELAARDPRALPGAAVGMREIIGVAIDATRANPAIDEAMEAGVASVRSGTIDVAGATRLLDALELGQRELTGALPRTRLGSLELADVLHGVAAGDESAARSIAAFADDADTETLLRGALQGSADEFTPAHWTELATFADAHGVDPAHVAALGRAGSRSTPDAAARRAVAALRVQLDDSIGDASAVRDEFRTLVGKPATLSHDEIQRLSGLLDLDDARRLQVSRSIPGARDLDDLLHGLLDRSSTPSTNTTKYLTRWQVELDDAMQDPAGRQAAFRSLVERDPSTWSNVDIVRLQAMLDLDRATGSLGISREIPGVRDIDELVTALVDGSSTPSSNTARYVARWRAELDGVLDDPTRMRSFVEGIARHQDPSSIPMADWERLRLVLAHDADNSIGIAREMPGGRDLDELLAALVDGSSTPGSNTARYLASWRLQFDGTLDDPAALKAAIRSFVDRDPATLSNADWQQLRTMLDADVDNASGLARELPNVRDLDELLGALVDGTSSAGSNTGAYWAHWRNQFDGLLDDPVRMRTFASELIQREPETLARVEWARLRSMFASDPDAARLPLARQVTGARDLDELLVALADGSSTPGSNTALYVAYWRNQLDGTLDDPARMRAALADLLVDRDPATLSKSDWARVRAIMSEERHANELGLTRSITGTRDLSDLLAALVDGTSTPGDNTARYLARWRPELDPTWRSRRVQAYQDAIGGGAMPGGARADELESLGLTVEAIGADAMRGLRLRLLATAAPASVDQAQAFLAEVRTITGELGAPAADSPIAPVWARAMDLVERNEQRLAGHTPAGAVKGYGNHPDYAELGRIRSDLELVAAVGGDDARAGATAASGDVVATAAPASDAAGAAPATADTLTW